MTTQRLTPALLLAAFALLALPTEAHAGGFYISDRGVRPAGRGFAFVAGADDPQALWYNPAGLGFSGQQLLIDANLLFFRGSYTRVDSGGNTLPTVEAEVPLLPLPMLAYSDNFGLERWTFGAGRSPRRRCDCSPRPRPSPARIGTDRNCRSGTPKRVPGNGRCARYRRKS